MKNKVFSKIKLKNPSLKTIIWSVVLILVVAVLLYINSHPPIRHSIIKFFNPQYTPIEYQMEIKDTDSICFGRVKNTLFLMSGEGLVQIDNKLHTKTFANQSGSKPQFEHTKDNYIQYFSGSKTAFAGDLNSQREIKCNGNVITATINKNGYYAIATEEKGYKALVTVYNNRDEEIFKWHSADNYITGMSLSPDNKTLATSMMSFGNEHQKNLITVFKFSQDKPISSTEIKSNFVAKMKYVSSSKILLITSDDIIMLSPKGNTLWKASYNDEKFIDYSVSEDYIAVANQSSSALLGKSVINIYNYNGQKTGTFDNSEDLINLDISEDTILVANKKSIHIIDKKGKETNNIKFAKDIKEGLLFGDSHYAAIVTGNVLHSVKIN